MSNQDSFIDEVSEEVRKDKLYKLFRRYGWIAIAAVIVIVGGASIFEYRKAQARAAAQATGDALMEAVTQDTAEARASAIGAIATDDNAGQRAVVGLLQAAAELEAEDQDAARATLEGVAANADTPAIYRDLAILKASMIPGAAPEDKIAQLQSLMVPGNPFRLLAIEQRALAEIEMGQTDTAIETLQAIIADADRTEGLQRRATQLIVALGGTLEQS